MSTLSGLTQHDGLPGVRVAPVVRGRLGFAQAVLEALEAERPDVLAVDLPGFLNGGAWLETALSRLPLTTSLVMKRAADSLLLPFTPSDACCMAAWEVRRRHIPFECVDGFTPPATQGRHDPGPDSGLSVDSPPPANLEAYFAAAWAAMDSAWVGLWRGRAAMARAAETVHNLRRLSAAHGRVLFVADYRSWWLVRKFLRQAAGMTAPKPRENAPAALIFEDALALWHAGLMEMPGLALEFFRSVEAGRQFEQVAAAKAMLGRHAGLLEGLRPGAQWKSSALLDAAEELAGHGAAAEIAGRLLSYPSATCADADGRIPSFGSVTRQGIEPPSCAFDPADVFEAKPYYEPSSAELQTFFPPEERAARCGWGPTPQPFVTRTEGCRIAPSHDSRWSTDTHAEYLAQAAAAIRAHVGQFPLAPPLAAPPDCFTPTAFIWSSESDGDVRTLDDPNTTHRRIQLGERPPFTGPPADCIHTLCATRSENAAWWGPMVQYDFASSIATLYSGPEAGPARYEAVTLNTPPHLVCRQNPASDADLARFESDQVAAAFAVKWARNLALVAAYAGWQPSEALTELAGKRGVRILIAPIEVLPRTMTIRLRRRVFVDRNIKTSQGAGRRLENRFVNWRLHPARA